MDVTLAFFCLVQVRMIDRYKADRPEEVVWYHRMFQSVAEGCAGHGLVQSAGRVGLVWDPVIPG